MSNYNKQNQDKVFLKLILSEDKAEGNKVPTIRYSKKENGERKTIQYYNSVDGYITKIEKAERKFTSKLGKEISIRWFAITIYEEEDKEYLYFRMQMDGLSRNILSALWNTDLTQNKVRISFYEKEGFNNSSVRVGNEMIKRHPDYNMIEMNKLIEKEELRDGTTKTYFDKIDAVFFELLDKDWKFYNPNDDLNNFLPAEEKSDKLQELKEKNTDTYADDDLPF